VNAAFHDPSAALVVDGEIVAAAEEERFSRRKHGKQPVPFSAWELPEHAIGFCLTQAGLTAGDLDAVAYGYDPYLSHAPNGDITADQWEGLRTLYVRRAPRFLQTLLPELDPDRVVFVGHHLAHAASAYIAAPSRSSAVMVLDGRGETGSYLAGHAVGAEFRVHAEQALPHSLGLLYENLTEHLGFRRASDEYKVMAMAAYGRPTFIDALRSAIYVESDGGFRVHPIDFSDFAPRLPAEADWLPEHADLASSVQVRLEEVLLELAEWLYDRTGEKDLTMAGGVALNCVANSRIARDGPFERVWVQPAAGDSGTALGAALFLSAAAGDPIQPMRSAALGPGFSDDEIRSQLETAAVPFERPADLADAVAEVLAADGIVAWFNGRSEFGPRALGHRSLLADPRHAANLERLNDVKGREQFRPVAPMVLADRAAELFDGQIPSPYMLFTHAVRPGWAERIPAAVHVDGTARIQTIDPQSEPLVARMLRGFEARTDVPVVINTSLNTAGRPMVDDPRDALECFGSAPIDALAIGPFIVRRPARVSQRRAVAASMPA
jgi:carbamoyltransferase